jgi:signal transduction histidine kinase
MMFGAEAHQPPEPGDIVSLLRLLAEAVDTRSFFATLRGSLPRLLPGTRVDVLASERRADGQLLLSYGAAETPPPVTHTAASFVDWLQRQGYDAISTLPLTGAGQHLGWLILARWHGPFEPQALALTGQLAATIAQRLMYDQALDDLAARDEYSMAIEQRLRELEAVRLRATLAVGAAHDIRNLFASILGYTQLLQREAPTSLQHNLRTIALAAKDGHHLLRRMLSLKAPGAAPSEASVALLPNIIRDAIRLTRPFWDARPGLAVKTALAPVPAVRGNAADLREVLINLIMNAVAAMPEGGTLLLRSSAADDRVIVEVSDNGQGRALERHRAIVEPFAMTQDADTGIGLGVSRAIVEGYGGTLTMGSAKDASVTYTLALPAVWSLDTLREVRQVPPRERTGS